MDIQLRLIILAIVTLQCYVTHVNAISIKLIEGPGKIIYKGEERELTVDAGATITLQCSILYDTNTGSWFFSTNRLSDGNALITTNTEKYSLVVENESQYMLTIRSLAQEDAGLYRCKSGSDFDALTLFVATPIEQNEPEEPEPVEYAPTVTALVDSTGVVAVPDGGQASLKCRATSFPAVKQEAIEWYFQGLEGHEGGPVSTLQNFDGKWNVVYYLLSGEQDETRRTVLSVLTLSDVTTDQAGQYRCKFTNEIGSSYGTIGLQTIVEETPGGDIGGGGGGNDGGDTKKAIDISLRVTSAVALSATSIQIEWEAGLQIAEVDNYLVEVKTTNGVPEVVDVPSSETSVIVDGLEPSTEYLVSVQPVSDGIYGQSSQSVRVTTKDVSSVKPRRYDISDLGSPCLFRGWVDVQGQGAANDYCRVVSIGGGPQFLSCALAGSLNDHVYTSPNASVDWFDAGHMDTWYMKDEDGDGRDDYCRCVGVLPNTVVTCMKAGETGFLSHDDFQIQDTAECHYTKVNPFFGIS